MLSCEFCKIFKNIFLIEHLQWLLLQFGSFWAYRVCLSSYSYISKLVFFLKVIVQCLLRHSKVLLGKTVISILGSSSFSMVCVQIRVFSGKQLVQKCTKISTLISRDTDKSNNIIPKSMKRSTITASFWGLGKIWATFAPDPGFHWL